MHVTNEHLSDRQRMLLELMAGADDWLTVQQICDLLPVGTLKVHNINTTMQTLQFKLPGIAGMPYRVRVQNKGVAKVWRVVLTK